MRAPPFVPEMLPDELLYSWLSRLATLNALDSSRTTIEWMFGSRNVIPSVDLPAGLIPLFRALGQHSPHASPLLAIENATLYSYHRPFLSPARHEAALNILMEGHAMGLKTLMGRVANRFGASPALRLCRWCFEADVDSYGEPYWHRAHQLPGVSCCIEHGSHLIMQIVPSRATNRHRFVLPGRPAATGGEVDTQQIRFAQLSRSVLQAGLPSLDPQIRRATYLHAAAHQGLCNARGRVDYRGLSQSLMQYYGGFRGFVHRDRLVGGGARPLSWLRALIGKPSVSSHPICHLLLIGYLFGSIERFASATGSVLDNRQSAACSDDANRLNADQVRLLQDASVSSRSLARLLGRSVTTVVVMRRAMGVAVSERRKTLTEQTLAAIVSALRHRRPVVEIAASHKVSLSTVYRVRSQHPPLSKPDLARRKQGRRKRRLEWRDAIRACAGRGVKQARARAAAAYAWLYRNDRDWLHKSCTSIRLMPKSPPRVDWQARESVLIEKLDEVFKQILANPKRARVTATLLTKDLGEHMIRSRLDRMPRLRDRLEERVESVEKFQEFRVQRAIHRLAGEGLALALWRVQRLAGLKQWTATLQDYAMNLITDVERQGRSP